MPSHLISVPRPSAPTKVQRVRVPLQAMTLVNSPRQGHVAQAMKVDRGSSRASSPAPLAEPSTPRKRTRGQEVAQAARQGTGRPRRPVLRRPCGRLGQASSLPALRACPWMHNTHKSRVCPKGTDNEAGSEGGPPKNPCQELFADRSNIETAGRTSPEQNQVPGDTAHLLQSPIHSLEQRTNKGSLACWRVILAA